MAKFYTPTKLSENISETPEGFLLCKNVPICRTGEQIYGKGETPIEPNANGEVIVTRERNEVFRAETIASYEGKAVTIRHPEEFVDPDNWKELAKGHMQNVRKSDEQDEDGNDYLIADLLITDSLAIGLVKNGLREVSCGYDSEYVETGKGKGKQTKILGNHIALVDKGRAGPTYSITDHEGKGISTMSKIAALLKKLSKTADEEMKTEKKEEKATDENKAYDELVKMMKDMGEKIEAMKPSAKDEDEDEDEESEEKPAQKEEKKKEDKSSDEDEDEDEGNAIEERLKALEAAVEKLLEMESEEQGEDEDEDEDSDEDEDEESEEQKDEDEDEESEKKDMHSKDSARAEILAPGIKKMKDAKALKVKALKTFNGTKDGAVIIKALNKGKVPNFKSQKTVDHLFMAASEVMKHKRGTGLEGTKPNKNFDAENSGSSTVMTAEKMNEINAAKYGQK